MRAFKGIFSFSLPRCFVETTFTTFAIHGPMPHFVHTKLFLIFNICICSGLIWFPIYFLLDWNAHLMASHGNRNLHNLKPSRYRDFYKATSNKAVNSSKNVFIASLFVNWKRKGEVGQMASWRRHHWRTLAAVTMDLITVLLSKILFRVWRWLSCHSFSFCNIFVFFCPEPV